MIDGSKFLEDLSGRYARLYTAAIQDMVIGYALGNAAKVDAARAELDEVMLATMGTAEVLGATIVLRATAKVMGSEAASKAAFKHSNRHTAAHLLTFAHTATQTILPSVTFEEAVQDMVTRTPVTIRLAAERTAQRISQLYGEGRVVAFVRSAEQAVTERVQSLIAEAVREGIPELDFMRGGSLQPGAGTNIVDAVKEIRAKTAEWSEGYARMAFRTNVNTAITAGKWKQGLDPDIDSIMPAVQFNTAGDVDVRPNHAAGDGKIMLRRNANWNQLAPPIDYNCRCGVRDVGLPELRRMGRVSAVRTTGFTRVGLSEVYIREDVPPAAWHPNPAFRKGGRPDLFIGGA